MTTRLFVYVDETGQDTQGKFFIVGMVVTGRLRRSLIEKCREIENRSKKGRVKWSKTRHAYREEYIKRLTATGDFHESLFYKIFEGGGDYLGMTIKAVAEGLTLTGGSDYSATVFIDGLPDATIKKVRRELRNRGCSIKKARGVKKDENNELIRLADAVCGLVRKSHLGDKAYQGLLRQAESKGVVTSL